MSSTPPPGPPAPPPDGGVPPGATPPPGPGQPGAGGAAAYSVSDAFNYGWKKFQENLGAWILGILILFVGLAIIEVLYQLVFGGLVGATTETRYDPATGQMELVNSGGFVVSLIAAFVLAIPLAILGMIVQAQIVRAGLATCEGKIELGKFFETRRLGPVIVAAIIVAFFVQFYAYFVLDRDKKPWDSIKASFAFVNQHLANIIVLFLASLLAVVIGALLCGVGLLIAYPVVAIAHAYTFKVLNDEPVAPVTA